MDIVFDDDLQTKRHVVDRGDDEEEHQDRFDRIGKEGGDRTLLGADIRKGRGDKPQRERNEGHRGHPLIPEMPGSSLGRTQAFDPAEWCPEAPVVHRPSPPRIMRPMAKAPPASRSDPTNTTAAVTRAVEILKP